MRLWRWSIVLLLGTTVAFGGRLSFQEHAAVQESLARVHPRMRASWLRERGIDDPYYTAVRRPNSGQGLREVGRWSYGPSYDVDGRTTPSETLVALARGSGVSLLRFSRQDSLSIELLSDINAEGLMCRVKVVGTLLYVGSRKGLEVYDIADEQVPIRLSWIPLPLNDFDVQDSLAYTISGGYTDNGGDDSFRIYNVSNPSSPVLRGACRDSGSVVSVAGNAAFLGDRWGLFVLDVTNPTSPHRIASWGSAVEQVQARGHLCYVTTFNPNEPGDITFHILDVAVPSLPYQIGSLDSAGGNDVCLMDTLAYGAGETDFDKMTIVSVADSTRPRLLGSAGRPGSGEGVWASGLAQSAFVGSHWTGLQIYDARNPSLPVRDTFVLDADMAMDICVDNGRAYVADEMAGLKILDVGDPRTPTTLGSCDSGGQTPFMTSVVARDSFALVDWYGVPFFRVVNVSVPSRPMRLGGCDIFGPPEAMVLRDSFVYVAEINRFQIVNVARPREPVLLGSCVSTDGGYFGLAVEDTLAFVVGGADVEVVSIADPSNPHIVGNGGPGSYGVAARDTFAYIPYPYDTLLVYSVADPTNFRLLSAVPASYFPSDAALGESRVYVSGVYGIDIYRLDSPAQPVRLGSIATPDAAFRLTYAGGLLYAALMQSGIAIYETTAVGISERRQAVPLGGAQVRAAPNPVCDLVRIIGAAAGARVVMFDAVGRIVCVKPTEQKGGVIELNTSGLRSGVYFVEVKEKSATEVIRIVKP
jgi:hypothetical protein